MTDRERLRSLITCCGINLSKKMSRARQRDEYFIDIPKILLTASGSTLIGNVMLEHLSPLTFSSIGGHGAVPFALTTSVLTAMWAKLGDPSYSHLNLVTGYWVKSAPRVVKGGNLIGGTLHKNKPAAILLDVLMGTDQVLPLVAILQSHGCVVSTCLVLVDRLKNAKEILNAAGVPFQAVFTEDELIPKKQ